ncbi:unnamed protein product [Amoebophrya sp. A25]|nr:unnamed protein product [Amoebophrya sp. A25]|eukprot:GSA25T00021426001.1
MVQPPSRGSEPQEQNTTDLTSTTKSDGSSAWHVASGKKRRGSERKDRPSTTEKTSKNPIVAPKQEEAQKQTQEPQKEAQQQADPGVFGASCFPGSTSPLASKKSKGIPTKSKERLLPSEDDEDQVVVQSDRSIFSPASRRPVVLTHGNSASSGTVSTRSNSSSSVASSRSSPKQVGAFSYAEALQLGAFNTNTTTSTSAFSSSTTNNTVGTTSKTGTRTTSKTGTTVTASTSSVATSNAAALTLPASGLLADSIPSISPMHAVGGLGLKVEQEENDVDESKNKDMNVDVDGSQKVPPPSKKSKSTSKATVPQAKNSDAVVGDSAVTTSALTSKKNTAAAAASVTSNAVAIVEVRAPTGKKAARSALKSGSSGPVTTVEAVAGEGEQPNRGVPKPEAPKLRSTSAYKGKGFTAKSYEPVTPKDGEDTTSRSANNNNNLVEERTSGTSADNKVEKQVTVLKRPTAAADTASKVEAGEKRVSTWTEAPAATASAAETKEVATKNVDDETADVRTNTAKNAIFATKKTRKSKAKKMEWSQEAQQEQPEKEQGQQKLDSKCQQLAAQGVAKKEEKARTNLFYANRVAELQKARGKVAQKKAAAAAVVLEKIRRALPAHILAEGTGPSFADKKRTIRHVHHFAKPHSASSETEPQSKDSDTQATGKALKNQPSPIPAAVEAVLLSASAPGLQVSVHSESSSRVAMKKNRRRKKARQMKTDMMDIAENEAAGGDIGSALASLMLGTPAEDSVQTMIEREQQLGSLSLRGGENTPVSLYGRNGFSSVNDGDHRMLSQSYHGGHQGGKGGLRRPPPGLGYSPWQKGYNDDPPFSKGTFSKSNKGGKGSLFSKGKKGFWKGDFSLGKGGGKFCSDGFFSSGKKGMSSCKGGDFNLWALGSSSSSSGNKMDHDAHAVENQSTHPVEDVESMPEHNLVALEGRTAADLQKALEDHAKAAQTNMNLLTYLLLAQQDQILRQQAAIEQISAPPTVAAAAAASSAAGGSEKQQPSSSKSKTSDHLSKKSTSSNSASKTAASQKSGTSGTHDLLQGNSLSSLLSSSVAANPLPPFTGATTGAPTSLGSFPLNSSSSLPPMGGGVVPNPLSSMGGMGMGSLLSNPMGSGVLGGNLFGGTTTPGSAGPVGGFSVGMSSFSSLNPLEQGQLLDMATLGVNSNIHGGLPPGSVGNGVSSTFGGLIPLSSFSSSSSTSNMFCGNNITGMGIIPPPNSAMTSGAASGAPSSTTNELLSAVMNSGPNYWELSGWDKLAETDSNEPVQVPSQQGPSRTSSSSIGRNNNNPNGGTSTWNNNNNNQNASQNGGNHNNQDGGKKGKSKKSRSRTNSKGSSAPGSATGVVEGRGRDESSSKQTSKLILPAPEAVEGGHRKEAAGRSGASSTASSDTTRKEKEVLGGAGVGTYVEVEQGQGQYNSGSGQCSEQEPCNSASSSTTIRSQPVDLPQVPPLPPFTNFDSLTPTSIVMPSSPPKFLAPPPSSSSTTSCFSSFSTFGTPLGLAPTQPSSSCTPNQLPPVSMPSIPSPAPLASPHNGMANTLPLSSVTEQSFVLPSSFDSSVLCPWATMQPLRTDASSCVVTPASQQLSQQFSPPQMPPVLP